MGGCVQSTSYSLDNGEVCHPRRTTKGVRIGYLGDSKPEPYGLKILNFAALNRKFSNCSEESVDASYQIIQQMDKGVYYAERPFDCGSVITMTAGQTYECHVLDPSCDNDLECAQVEISVNSISTV